MRARSWLLYGGLLLLAILASFVGRPTSSREGRASIEDSGPRGARALYLYLTESDRPVSALRDPLTELPADTHVLVIAAPTARKVTDDELLALQRFVEGGGTLVYLPSRPIGEQQLRLDRWLGLHSASAPSLGTGGDRPRGDDVHGSRPTEQSDGAAREGTTAQTSPRTAPATDPAGATHAPSTVAGWSVTGNDPLGATVTVEQPHGAATGLHQLRVAADSTVSVDDGVAVAGRVLHWKPLGRGEVWIAAGPDLIENRRLELADNRVLWEQLSALGPLVFDEHHHRAAASAPLPLAVLAFAAQLLLCTAAFAFARGRRFGPPRPLISERHRSTLEYAEAMGGLIRRARVEPELLGALHARLRRQLHEQHGIPPALPDAEAARQLEERTRAPAAHTTAVLTGLRTAAQRPRISPAEYLRHARAAAELERALSGRGDST